MTQRPAQGRLIVFEGLDDVGKTTLAECLIARLNEADIPCKLLAFPGREPGSLAQIHRRDGERLVRLVMCDVGSRE